MKNGEVLGHKGHLKRIPSVKIKFYTKCSIYMKRLGLLLGHVRSIA
jgi:hypothetical protein